MKPEAMGGARGKLKSEVRSPKLEIRNQKSEVKRADAE
jgi:hypothetical protein